MNALAILFLVVSQHYNSGLRSLRATHGIEVVEPLVWLPAGDEEKVYRALDAGDVETLRRYDSAELIRILGHGRPVEGGKTGEFTEQITDAFGRTTDVHFRVPKKTGSLGVLIVLHGIGGDGTQLKDLYKNFAADQGLLVVAPSAQKEPEKALNEDALTGPLSERFPHWWSYRDGNFVFTALAWLNSNNVLIIHALILHIKAK